ncbi:RecT-like DNA pairing protein [Mycobacterium phage Xavia]|uniref:RecT-like DNA pairing protein n=1 Tax=Mycobacterium phage Xavia TaxID=2178923 RepID=A0A2U8UI17_9CAUD|nr:RecT-like ssDNA annealing protein [Mycobacterium phage Xavia]AWN02655.1 RecT-like DNA pairing protein [Mycobacterium phage Xavia]
MTTAVEKRNDKPTLAQLIEQMKPEIAKVLPAQLKPERMARIATTVIRQTPALARTSPESFLGSLLTASQLGLEPGGVRPGCYFVPYGNVCTFIPSWYGLVDLARRSGQVVDVWAEIVYEKDIFVYTLGLHRTIERHDPPPLGEDRGKPIGVYAAAELVSGGKPFVVMTVAEVEKIRARSKASKNGPWVTDWEAMAKKTAVKQLSKWLPASAELNSALTLDGTVRTDIGPLVDVKPDYVDGEIDDNAAAEPADVPDDADPDVIDGEATEIRMASNDQLRRLAEIQKAEKYTDADWFSFLAEAAGVQAKRAADLTFEEAARAIAVFDGPDQ